MGLNYLLNYGVDNDGVASIVDSVTDSVFSELSLFEKIVAENIAYMKDFGVNNYAQVVVKYPEIFLRDAESFKNVFSKFDREDLIQKVEKNPAVFKKMVDFVDNN